MLARRKCEWNLFVIFGVAMIVFSASVIAAEQAPKINPDEALQRLKEGNERFTTGKSEHPNVTRERLMETTTNGQHPFATVVSCSDSRVPVEILFDQGVGDIFVVRVAGNVCNVDEIGSVEYGTDHLGTPVLVVLGHSRCGAVTAVAQGAELHGNVHTLVHNIYAAVETTKKTHPELQGDAFVAAAIESNVWESIADLLKTSPAVRERVASGKLKITGARYDLEEGRVQWLGEHPDQDKLLKNAGSETGAVQKK